MLSGNFFDSNAHPSSGKKAKKKRDKKRDQRWRQEKARKKAWIKIKTEASVATQKIIAQVGEANAEQLSALIKVLPPLAEERVPAYNDQNIIETIYAHPRLSAAEKRAAFIQVMNQKGCKKYAEVVFRRPHIDLLLEDALVLTQQYFQLLPFQITISPHNECAIWKKMLSIKPGAELFQLLMAETNTHWDEYDGWMRPVTLSTALNFINIWMDSLTSEKDIIDCYQQIKTKLTPQGPQLLLSHYLPEIRRMAELKITALRIRITQEKPEQAFAAKIFLKAGHHLSFLDAHSGYSLYKKAEMHKCDNLSAEFASLRAKICGKLYKNETVPLFSFQYENYNVMTQLILARCLRSYDEYVCRSDEPDAIFGDFPSRQRTDQTYKRYLLSGAIKRPISPAGIEELKKIVDYQALLDEAPETLNERELDYKEMYRVILVLQDIADIFRICSDYIRKHATYDHVFYADNQHVLHDIARDPKEKQKFMDFDSAYKNFSTNTKLAEYFPSRLCVDLIGPAKYGELCELRKKGGLTLEVFRGHYEAMTGKKCDDEASMTKASSPTPGK